MVLHCTNPPAYVAYIHKKYEKNFQEPENALGSYEQVPIIVQSGRNLYTTCAVRRYYSMSPERAG